MEIVVTAMTKVRNRVCLAGINLEDNSWVRPVWTYSGGAWPGITYYRSGALIEVGDVIRLKSPRRCPTPPHTEDVLTSTFSWVRTMGDEEFCTLLKQVVDHGALDEVVTGLGDCSLCLIQPTEFESLYVDPEDAATTRIGFWIDDVYYQNNTKKPGFPCTDLRWRAFRREYGYDLDVFEYDEIFLAMGLTRSYNGRYNPMVVSVITFPSFNFELDPENL